jgi:KDO2-lipid IV(A) lauroyltransferase
MGKSWLAPMDKVRGLVTETEGMDAFREAIASGQGLILLAPHLSNWEVFGYYTAKDADTTFMYQPPKSPTMDALLKKTRSRGGIELAPANRQGVAQLMKSLQRGGLVGILPDQVPTDSGGLHADFFGHPALTMTLVSKLLARRPVPVFCGFAERLPSGRGFRVIIQQADPTIYSEDLAESVRGLNLSVEACVRRAVPQYQWEYKRFRRQPDGRQFY